jgi:transposase
MVDTIDGNTEADAAQAASPGRVQASGYSACCEPGGSIAGIAMANGINANQVHRWMRERGIEPPMRYFPMRSTIEPAAGMAPAFTSVPIMPGAPELPAIRIEIRRGKAAVKISLPTDAAIG